MTQHYFDAQHRKPPIRGKRMLTMTPAGAMLYETVLWNRMRFPDQALARQQMLRAEKTISQSDPHMQAMVRQDEARRLLREAGIIRDATVILHRLAADGQVSPRAILDHAERGLITAAEALFPDGLPTAGAASMPSEQASEAA
jgi:hypothetical protein